MRSGEAVKVLSAAEERDDARSGRNSTRKERLRTGQQFPRVRVREFLMREQVARRRLNTVLADHMGRWNGELGWEMT